MCRICVDYNLTNKEIQVGLSPDKKKLYEDIKWLVVNFYKGYFVFKYPICCVLYFCKMSFRGYQVAFYDEHIKGKSGRGTGRIFCDKCFENKRLNLRRNE